MAEINTDTVDSFDPFNRPIPGQSLTNDPDNPNPWEQAPTFTTVKDALDSIFTDIMSEERLPSLIEILASNRMSIMSIVKVLLEQGFREGKWNPDLMLLLAEPVAIIMMALSERAEIRNYEIYDGESSEIDEEDKNDLVKKSKENLANSKIFGLDMPSIKKESVPQEILESIEQADIPTTSLLEKQ